MKRRAAAVACAVFAGMVALVLIAESGDRENPPVPAAPAVVMATPPQPELPAATPRDAASAVAPAVVLARPQGAAASAPAQRVCGIADVPAGPDADEREMQALERHATPMIDTWRRQLAGDADPRRRAVGLMMGGGSDQESDRRDSLVALALASREPAVVGIAVVACAGDVGKPGAGACARLHPSLWIEVDGGHAEPWMHLAGIAWAQHDTAAVDAALRRAAALPYGRRVEQAWFAALRDGAPRDADPMQRYVMGVTLVGMLAATWAPDYAAALGHCAEKALSMPGRRALCEQLADQKVYRGPTLLDRLNGIGIARHLGWSADRLATIDREQRRLQHALMDEAAPGAMSCAQVERQLRFLERRVELGEIDAAHALQAERRR